mmetsp:Transcript_7232/g.19231  ORF Transcript_7232/g.19231 Transcript_7232/m.19231 type:complete len:225 (-) Transcript_7232:27-701(-)
MLGRLLLVLGLIWLDGRVHQGGPTFQAIPAHGAQLVEESGHLHFVVQEGRQCPIFFDPVFDVNEFPHDLCLGTLQIAHDVCAVAVSITALEQTPPEVIRDFLPISIRARPWVVEEAALVAAAGRRLLYRLAEVLLAHRGERDLGFLWVCNEVACQVNNGLQRLLLLIFGDVQFVDLLAEAQELSKKIPRFLLRVDELATNKIKTGHGQRLNVAARKDGQGGAAA